jgi:pimeloyl-ACP methyl ester carboxylesterase
MVKRVPAGRRDAYPLGQPSPGSPTKGYSNVGQAAQMSPHRMHLRRSATLTWTEFTTHDDEPLVAGLRAGSGPPILLLHGGPGLGFDYLRDLADELAQENTVVWYQQRGFAALGGGTVLHGG